MSAPSTLRSEIGFLTDDQDGGCVSFVMGPMRSGTSVVTASLAAAAAGSGADVLVVATDDAPVLSMLTETDELDDRERAAGIDGVSFRVRRIATGSVFSEVLGQGGLGGMFRRAMSGPSLPLIAAAVPGLDDLLVLREVFALAEKRAADLILVDSPSGGRGIDFLGAVEAVHDVVQSPELLEVAIEVQEACADHERSQAIVVSAPERQVIADAVELARAAHVRKAMSVRLVVDNLVGWPTSDGTVGWPTSDGTVGWPTRAADGASGTARPARVELPWLPDGVTEQSDVSTLAAALGATS